MSDYIYMLESHLNPGQNRAVAAVQGAAAQSGLNLFLTGGAMRDMLAGFRVRDLDFVVEGNALLATKAISDSGGTLVATEEVRRTAEFLFPGGVTAQIAMARREKSGRNGARPQVVQATIHEDLRGRDFTCNAIALSLTKSSRGLLLDPLNGLADIERRELRSANPYGFYDDPSRLLRLIRLRVRLGFTVEERTQTQAEAARQAALWHSIPPQVLGEELRQIATEENPSEILKLLEENQMTVLFSPALEGPKLNLGGIVKLEKAAKLLPEEGSGRAVRLGPFLFVLTEKLSTRESQAFAKAVDLSKAEVAQWQRLEARAKKLETGMRATRIRKPSHVYHLVSAAPLDEVLFLLYHSALKPVQERLRNYFQKYLPAVQEITAEEWSPVEAMQGTPRYQKARTEFITRRLDRRPPKPPVPDPDPPPVTPAAQGSSWRGQPNAAARRGSGQAWGGHS